MSMEPTARPLIQVVEDDPHLNMALSETLRSYDFAVESFANGVEALAWLQNHRPDVILCDILMPEMDGYTLLRHTRATPELRMLPFIFLTARTSMADQRLAREIGVEDYLTKPIDSESLVIAIKNVLRRQQRMQEAMNRQMDELRNRIVTVLQHEFRTPLTFVLGYAEYLLEAIETGYDREELHKSVSAILDGGQRLQRLIESFLLLAELQNHKLKSEELRDLNPYLLWHSVVYALDPASIAPNLQIEVGEETEDVVINGNAALLEEALRRLLDNAIKYSRPDSQRIQLLVQSKPPYVGLQIIDDGVGMTAEQVKALAKPFEQLNRENRTEPGAGLSLALVRHIAVLHGGNLQIDSVPGKGSTFTIWLPAAHPTVQ
jgi:two-component system sensor histidine kinase/response regulator